MANCDLCGKETELVDAIVEGSMLSICKGCAKFGHVIAIQKPALIEEKPEKKITIEEPEPEELEIIVPDYASKIKQARENLNLKQKQLASEINEKESVIHKLESGHLKPSIKLAKKLESFLNIKLIEEYQEPQKKELSFADKSLTIGDLIKIKKEKRRS